VPQVSRGPALHPMQYQVLARKWRPQNFHDLVGQEHVSQTLLNALKLGRVAHAFLFSGPRGSGKTTTARILAKALNCHQSNSGEPCGQCAACKEIAAGNCMDVLEIDAASNRGIDEIRELREEVRYKPARDRNKIFIIDEVHMLTPEAFNALLKTLEEPPPHVIFVMATTEYHKIPATILSRCQQYNFKLISFPLILSRLTEIARRENIRISVSALEQITFSSGGSMRDAMSALDQVIAFSGEEVRDQDVIMLLGLVEPSVLGNTVRAIAGNDSDRILHVVSNLVEAGQDLRNFCRRLLRQFRNLMVLKAGVTDLQVIGVPESLVPDLRQQAELFSTEDLLRIFDALLKTEDELKDATNPRFQLEMGLIELAQLPRVRSLETLIAEFSAFVKGNLPGPSRTETAPGTSGAPVERESSRPTKPRKGDASVSSLDAPSSSSKTSELIAPSPVEQLPPQDLLQKIAGAVQKESIASALRALPGAELKDDLLVLDVTPVNEFFRRQIQENTFVITEAAFRITGRSIKISFLHELRSPAKAASAAPPLTDILERARREPIVQSFLDRFPGPVKAEEIDS
jgi:DNA polymerase III subunit gamma/tau